MERFRQQETRSRTARTDYRLEDHADQKTGYPANAWSRATGLVELPMPDALAEVTWPFHVGRTR